MISVIVPVYNCEKYINTCADSILKQDFKDLEIIFVNDGSTDNSLEEILKIQKNDKRIKIIKKKMVVCLLQEMLAWILRKENLFYL